MHAERMTREDREAYGLVRERFERGDLGGARAPLEALARRYPRYADLHYMIGIVHERLDRSDARRGFVLDGFPRTVVQATALDHMVEGRGPLVVLDIVVPEDVLVRRLATRRICSKCGTNAGVEWTDCQKCGGTLVARTDDGESVVRERLKVYQRQTKPLVDYYSARSTFRTIDGDQPPDVVTTEVDAAVDEAMAAGGAAL